MSLSTKQNIQKAFSEHSFDKKKQLSHEARMIMFRFLSEVEKISETRGLNKSDLAKIIGTSRSYITQLFRGSKLINLETLARLEQGLGVQFKIKLCSDNEEWLIDNADEKEIFLKKYHSKDGFWAFHELPKGNIYVDQRIKSADYSNSLNETHLKIVA